MYMFLYLCTMYVYVYRSIMDGDLLSTAFEMMKQYGLEGTLRFFLNAIIEPSSLVAVKERFHNVERGDHLVYKTAMGWNIHFYVIDNLGGGSLKISGFFLEENSNLFVEEELIFKPGQAQEINVQERILCKGDIMQKLKKKLYKETTSVYNEECRIDVFKRQRNYYDFLHNNSEHFINFVKTGQAHCQIAVEIENFIRKHIFAQTVWNNMEMVKTVLSWAEIIGVLSMILLKHSGVDLAIHEALEDILKEVEKVIPIKSIAKTMTKASGKFLVSQAVKSVTKQAVKEGGKAAATQTVTKAVVQKVSKEVLEKGGKAATNQVAKSAAKVAVQQASKEALKQGAKNAAVNAVKQAAKGSVVAGLAIEVAIYSVNMGTAIKDYSNGDMDYEQFVDFTVEQTTTSGGSVTGGIGGSLAGAAAGAAIGSVVPIIGTAIGATIGGIAGGISGGIGGSLLGKSIGEQINYSKK